MAGPPVVARRDVACDSRGGSVWASEERGEREKGTTKWPLCGREKVIKDE